MDMKFGVRKERIEKQLSMNFILVDMENMHGNLLDAMSNAIEKSSIFLMCLTEKYKDSPSCRLECEYAFQKKKKMIPLLLQANYKPE